MYPELATPYRSPAARQDYVRQETKPGRAWWPWLVISQVIAVVAVVVLAISQNGKEAEPEGPLELAAIAVAMLLIVDVISAIPALIGAAILTAFKKHFGRSFVVIFSVILTLFSVLLFIGAVIPEEWVEEEEPVVPQVPVEVE